MKTSVGALVLVWTQSLCAQHEGDADTSMATLNAIATTTTAKTSSASGSVQTINVGKSGLEFSPYTLNVAAGDKVEFHFFPGDHSVTQASSDNPCHPLSGSSFSSGFVTGSSNGSPPVFALIVNNTKFIWFFCGQVGHCQAGMVGVINPE
ncbi:Cupredoxin [Penicillium maclennaniae]|uniref:Cupredoxin n=1 Tax=Penicillium maclennaniae TaxID=1343394 RepID=UPI0025424042|nr:Cupredoxin [Penicillium maclennaniae]KAJ5684788.1 Cupredoxin [Penicillium maclennaniae]